MGRDLHLTAVATLFVAALSPAVGMGQELAAEEAEAYESEPWATVWLDLDPRTRNMWLNVWYPSGPTDALPAAMDAALGCPGKAEDYQPDRFINGGAEDYVNFSRYCSTRREVSLADNALAFDLTALKLALAEAGVEDLSFEVHLPRGVRHKVTPQLDPYHKDSTEYYGDLTGLPRFIRAEYGIGFSSPVAQLSAIALGLVGMPVALALLGLISLSRSERSQSRWQGLVNSGWTQFAFIVSWYFAARSADSTVRLSS